jgi:uncharacterized protein YPO0396
MFFHVKIIFKSIFTLKHLIAPLHPKPIYQAKKKTQKQSKNTKSNREKFFLETIYVFIQDESQKTLLSNFCNQIKPFNTKLSQFSCQNHDNVPRTFFSFIIFQWISLSSLNPVSISMLLHINC